jgi:hypothetical protein
MTNTATTEQQLLAAVRQNNLLLLQLQNSIMVESSALNPKELKIERMKQEFERRAMLPEDTRPPWVCSHEAAWLLGIAITPSNSHIRRLRWCHQHGYLVTTNGGNNSLNFLRNEVMTLNELVIAGKVVIPRKCS